jgi:hypothetical protein
MSRFERTTQKIPAVGMRELVYGPKGHADALRRRVAEIKARIDPEKLRLTRARLRRRGTKRVIKSVAGPVVFLGSLIFGGAAIARRASR